VHLLKIKEKRLPCTQVLLNVELNPQETNVKAGITIYEYCEMCSMANEQPGILTETGRFNFK